MVFFVLGVNVDKSFQNLFVGYSVGIVYLLSRNHIKCLTSKNTYK